MVFISQQVRAVHSRGGAAGGVISEGQGYGLAIGGITLAAMRPAVGQARWDTAVQETYELFLGWRHMCRMSRDDLSCQSPYYCGERCPHSGSLDSACHPCLPHWKFQDDMSAAISTGAAPDGDVDAILGIILLLLATEPVKTSYSWWDEVAKFAYQSCKQFYESNTKAGEGSSAGLRILKLGSCWGGFSPECNSPSYHAPGAMRAMCDFMKTFDATVGAASEGDTYEALWNAVVETSYLMLKDNQCPRTGMTTNWFRTGDELGLGRGATDCSGSGTPSAEFGS
eukprot:TRINITY_DN98740_c0_g1_i1.p1 TRINITY_DN98740_c0_g1~~TRINITY_DN98740_c0_g1_i1.p1  ORF type:complete len:283 (+),score=39.07 TRINITY_DN98740_c0_g1_i1:40-888(+)